MRRLGCTPSVVLARSCVPPGPSRRRRRRDARSPSAAAASKSSTCTRTASSACRGIVKGTALETSAGGLAATGARPAAPAADGSAGRRRAGAHHQRLLVVRRRPRPRRPHRAGAERRAGRSGWRRIRIASSRWRRWRCSIPTWRPSSWRTASSGSGLRGASIGGHVNGEDLSLPKFDPFWAKAAELGVLVFMHPGGAENIVKEGALRRPRRSRQHHRQPARDDVLPLALDLRRDVRQVPRPARRAARTPAATCRRISGGPKRPATSARNANCANKKKPSEYLRVADPHRHDGVLGRRAAAPGRRGRRSARSSTAPTCRSTGR